ncbi:MAG: molybdopterin-dependent oxidoreductase [Coriobacteriia bacterium]|nr:molybdopterin-dependent oxidoreductase [Coriobacteriia bacterium]
MRYGAARAAAFLLCLTSLAGCSTALSDGPPQDAPRDDIITLDGVEIREYEGTDLGSTNDFRDILEEVTVRPSANTVILRAVDGYSTSFPLQYFYDNDILLAYSMNGATLPPERGFPFQLVAEDRWGYKWIKWISEIELSDDEGYQGYWESRGYSDSGDLDKSFLDGD